MDDNVGGQDVDTRLGQGRDNYRDLRERTKRQERSREESLKRIVELHRERHLHSFQKPGTEAAKRGGALGDLEIAA
jgi:hypothetical protein